MYLSVTAPAEQSLSAVEPLHPEAFAASLVTHTADCLRNLPLAADLQGSAEFDSAPFALRQ